MTITKPDGMSNGGIDVWDALLPGAEHLQPTDAHLFAMLCESIAMTRRLDETERAYLEDTDAEGRVLSIFEAWRKANADTLKLATALKMTPQSRDAEQPDTEDAQPRPRLYARTAEPAPKTQAKPRPVKRQTPSRTKTTAKTKRTT